MEFDYFPKKRVEGGSLHLYRLTTFLLKQLAALQSDVHSKLRDLNVQPSHFRNIRSLKNADFLTEAKLSSTLGRRQERGLFILCTLKDSLAST